MDFEGINPTEMFDDDTPIEEFLYLICIEFRTPDEELLNWIDVLQNSDSVQFNVIKVKDLKKLVSNRAIWKSLNLPPNVQRKVEEYLFPEGILDEEETPKLNRTRERRNTVISPEVLNLISSPNEVNINLDDEGIDPDLADELSQLGINIGEKKENSSYELVLSNCGLSSFQEDEIEWMIRVLESSQRKHALAIVRLYTCKVGENEWEYTNIVGGLALVTEANLQNQCSHFIRIIDLNGFNPNKSTIFQQEFYFGMRYSKDSDFFHSFEGTNILIGLSFASVPEADYFFEKVQYCLTHKPIDVIEETYGEKEKSYMLVGENSVRIATDGSNISVKTRQKYATGGITDGIEVKWSKPRPPDTVLEIIGPTDTDKQEDEKENKVRARRNTVYHETEVIDLIKEGNAIPRMDRSATLSLGASPTLFSEGNSSFVDGINLNWTKNATALTADADTPKSTEDIKKDLELRIKRLRDRKKNALEVGDKETAARLRDQIKDLTIELRKYYTAKPQKNSFFKKIIKS